MTGTQAPYWDGEPPVLAQPAIVLTGAYGSGKTETALNLAAYLGGRNEGPVTLVDLDVIKPYFRARELQERFRRHGVRVASAADGFARADVPAISPAILAALRLEAGRLVVDLAGEKAGARVLRGLLQGAPERKIALYLVVNPYRPFTSDVASITRTARDLAEMAAAPLAGLVANPHLLGETTVDRVLSGYATVAEAAAELGTPVAWLGVSERLAPEVQGRVPIPLFVLRRFLRPPWEETEREGVFPSPPE